MSKTFKTSMIFFITTVWLLLMRIVIPFVNIGDYLNDWLFSFLTQVVGMGLIPFLLYRFWVKEDPFEGFYLKRKIRPIIYVFAVAVGILLSFLVPALSGIWTTVLRLIGYSQGNVAGTVYPLGDIAWAILAMELFTSSVLPGIFEEINFRGLGMQMFSEVEDDRKKILLLAILFAFGHQFILQTGYTFVVGFIIAFLIVKTRSVVPGMIIHFVNNAVAVFSQFSSQRTGVFSGFREGVYSVFFKNIFVLLVYIAVLGIILAVLLWLIGKFSQSEELRKEKEDEYYYPNKTQYVDDIFGDLTIVRETAKAGVRWYEYAPLYGAAVIMIVSTIFTFVWGVGR